MSIIRLSLLILMSCIYGATIIGNLQHLFDLYCLPLAEVGEVVSSSTRPVGVDVNLTLPHGSGEELSEGRTGSGSRPVGVDVKLPPAGSTEDLSEEVGDSNLDQTSSSESSDQSALDQRASELILENLKKKKGALADGESLAEINRAVKSDFNIETTGQQFEYIRQLEREKESSLPKFVDQNPATLSVFNEIKDFKSKSENKNK